MTLYVNELEHKRICCVVKINEKLKRRIYINENGTVEYNDYDVESNPIFDKDYDILLGFEE